jgi:hypothetical protein
MPTVEAKLLQTAASLRTCFVLVIHPRAPKPLVPFLGILSSGCQNIELSFRSWPKRNQYLANSFPGPAPFRGNSNQQVLSPLISWKRFRGSSNAVHRDVATLQIKCPKLFKFRISAGKRKSHIDEPERVPPHRNLSISLTSDRVRFSRTFWNRTSRAKSRGRRSITAPS